MIPKIALQLYSVNGVLEQDVYGTLKKIKELGYDGIELTRIFEKEPVAFGAMCRELGLDPFSAHINFNDLCERPQDIIDFCKTVGCRYVVISVFPDEYKPGIGDFDFALKKLPGVGRLLKENGLTLQFHNHFFEFERLGEQYALDLMYQAVPPDLLQTQLDTCWINVSGEDPCAYLEKYKGRCPTVHLRDFVGRKKFIPFAASYLPENCKPEWDKDFQDRPLGQGLMQMETTLKTALDCGAEWLVVENGPCGEEYPPLKAAEISINFIKEHI